MKHRLKKAPVAPRKKRARPKPVASSSRRRSTGGPAPRPSRGHLITPAKLRLLQDTLREAQETLEAIRSGEVDAVVVKGANGNQIYSMAGAEQPYRVYVEQMQEGAVTVSAEGLVLYCNRRFAEMVQRPLEKVISSTLTEYLPAPAWTSIARVFGAADEAVTQVATLRRHQADDLAVNLTASRLPIQGEEMMCLVVTDLSAQRKVEEFRLGKELAEKASAAKDGFLAALSHELRTPLTPALMVATVLEKDRTLPVNVQSDIALIRRNVELEARLIDDLLDLTRISHGKLTLHRGEIDLHHVLNRAIEICEPDVKMKNQQLVLTLEASHTAAVGDMVRIQQALWNVLRNAVKFTGENGIIRVTTRNLPEARLAIAITDTGIGFAPESVPTLFQAFEQGGRNITRQYGGLGLGLAISRSIVEAHGGVVHARSDGPGTGATFTFEFPLAKTPVMSASKDPFVASKKTVVPSSTILLVEDHKDTRQSVTRLLQLAGHRVVAAGSAGEALTFAAGQRFDLVISDLGLPDQSGHELMSQLRDLYGLAGIALSGYGMEEDVERSHRAGFRDHLTKPVSFERLKSLIAKFAPPAP